MLPSIMMSSWMKGQGRGCIPCGAKEPVVTPLDTIDCIYSRADNTILVSGMDSALHRINHESDSSPVLESIFMS